MKLLMLIPIALLVMACAKEGPMERAGEEIDEAVEDVGAGGKTIGNQVDDAIDEVGKDVGDAIKHAN